MRAHIRSLPRYKGTSFLLILHDLMLIILCFYSFEFESDAQHNEFRDLLQERVMANVRFAEVIRTQLDTFVRLQIEVSSCYSLYCFVIDSSFDRRLSTSVRRRGRSSA